MSGTAQKRTQKTKPKKQPRKVKAASTVNVVVKTQAVAVNSKTKTGGKRTPRRKPEPAVAATPAPTIYASVFNTSPVIPRQPVYDYPVQYEPAKLPAVDIQNMPLPSLQEKPTAVSVETETEPAVEVPVKPTTAVGTRTTRVLTNQQLFDYARMNNVPGIKKKMNKTQMLKILENAGHKF